MQLRIAVNIELLDPTQLWTELPSFLKATVHSPAMTSIVGQYNFLEEVESQGENSATNMHPLLEYIELGKDTLIIFLVQRCTTFGTLWLLFYLILH